MLCFLIAEERYKIRILCLFHWENWLSFLPNDILLTSTLKLLIVAELNGRLLMCSKSEKNKNFNYHHFIGFRFVFESMKLLTNKVEMPSLVFGTIFDLMHMKTQCCNIWNVSWNIYWSEKFYWYENNVSCAAQCSVVPFCALLPYKATFHNVENYASRLANLLVRISSLQFVKFCMLDLMSEIF